jgi:two-component system LytT family response regulator
VLLQDGSKLFVLKSLKDWEARLPAAQFARIHRSTIVNLESIEAIDDASSRSYRVRVKGVPEPVVASRRYSARLRERLR